MADGQTAIELEDASAEAEVAQTERQHTTLKDHDKDRTTSKENGDVPPDPEPLARDSTFVQKKKKRKLQKKWVLVWVSRIIPGFAGLGAFLYLVVLLASPEIWKTNEDAEEEEILDRESSRGTFVSVCIAILMNCIGWLMFRIGVKEGLVVTNYGFILGPVVGFMMDQGVGSDAGFRHFFRWEGFAYTFGSLIGGNFMRYIVTIFLDLFISNPLQDVMKRQAKKMGVIEELTNDDKKGRKMKAYDHFVALNFPSILQSIVAFVTFNAYTNQTRFAWAYPALSVSRDFRIPPGAIMLSAAIAGVLYLNFYTIMDLVSDREYFDVNTKLMYVVFILLLLYGLNFTDSMEAPLLDEPDNNITAVIQDEKPALGFFLFVAFVCYGFVYPLYTRLGCCGHFIGGQKSERELAADTDHITNQPTENMELSEELVNAIKAQIEEQLLLHQQQRHEAAAANAGM